MELFMVKSVIQTDDYDSVNDEVIVGKENAYRHFDEVANKCYEYVALYSATVGSDGIVCKDSLLKEVRDD